LVRAGEDTGEDPAPLIAEDRDESRVLGRRLRAGALSGRALHAARVLPAVVRHDATTPPTPPITPADEERMGKVKLSDRLVDVANMAEEGHVSPLELGGLRLRADVPIAGDRLVFFEQLPPEAEQYGDTLREWARRVAQGWYVRGLRDGRRGIPTSWQVHRNPRAVFGYGVDWNEPATVTEIDDDLDAIPQEGAFAVLGCSAPARAWP
jgi:hypothetical protein